MIFKIVDGGLIRQEMDKQGLSLRQLGHKISYSPDHLSNICRQRRRPSLACMLAISKALNKDIGYFLRD